MVDISLLRKVQGQHGLPPMVTSIHLYSFSSVNMLGRLGQAQGLPPHDVVVPWSTPSPMSGPPESP